MEEVTERDEAEGLVAPDEVEWEPCVDLAGADRMRPVPTLKPEVGEDEDGNPVVLDVVYRLEEVPPGHDLRPDYRCSTFIRLDPRDRLDWRVGDGLRRENEERREAFLKGQSRP